MGMQEGSLETLLDIPSPRARRMDSERMGRSSSVKYPANESSGAGACIEGLIWVISMLLVCCTFPFSLWVCMKQVQEYERAVIFRLGRVKKGGSQGPGLFFIIPCMDTIVVTDLRTVTFDVPPQEILSKDSVTVAVDAVVYYKIRDPMAAVCNVQDSAKSTRLLASTTLRNILGTKTLAEILSDREVIGENLLTQLDTASDILSDSPAALQLRYLQTLTNISAEKNSTIIFPLPIDMLTQMAGASK